MRDRLRVIAIIFAVVGAWLKPSNALAVGTEWLSDYPNGSIVIKTSERKLYLVRSADQPITFSLGVGREGLKWVGQSYVAHKIRWPVWEPPAAVRRDHPHLPLRIPPGDPENPLGEAVLVLGDGTYGIHGTNKPFTIGTDASYGCFRMMNLDVLDLFYRVRIGTPVFVLQ